LGKSGAKEKEMVFKSEKLERVVQEKPRGGEGSQECFFAFQMGKAPEGSAFQVVARQILSPGSSVGYHEHVDNADLYVIVSGNGTYTDENNQKVAVGPGDFTLCVRGQSHGLANSGTEPLVFIAVVAK
jgi:mannose-6-phosphate isomerase-like protein (cupin superfamily)